MRAEGYHTRIPSSSRRRLVDEGRGSVGPAGGERDGIDLVLLALWIIVDVLHIFGICEGGLRMLFGETQASPHLSTLRESSSLFCPSAIPCLCRQNDFSARGLVD
jgi:hypothetical protein